MAAYHETHEAPHCPTCDCSTPARDDMSTKPENLDASGERVYGIDTSQEVGDGKIYQTGVHSMTALQSELRHKQPEHDEIANDINAWLQAGHVIEKLGNTPIKTGIDVKFNYQEKK